MNDEMKNGKIDHIDEYQKDKDSMIFKYDPNKTTKIHEIVTQASLWEKDKTLVKAFYFHNGMVQFIDIETGIRHNIGIQEFLQTYVYIKPDDLNAIYSRRTNDNEWVRITDAEHDYCVYYLHSGGEFSGKADTNDVESFHKQYKLITLYPSAKDNDNFIKKSSIPDYKNFFNKTPAVWPGAIWYHDNAGIHIAITIKEENGTVWFVNSDNKVLDLYWTMPFKEWVEKYKLYDGVVKPSCFPEGSFDEMLEETKGRYERVMEKLKEEEKIKADEKETYLKTDKSKLEDFGTGAKREDKTGKGRYDLIPGDVMSDLEDFVWCSYFKNGNTTCSSTDVSKSAYFEDWQNVELYYDFIFNMISYFFIPKNDRIECCDDNGELSYEVTWDLFRKGIYDMRKALAKHYEAGAEIHGVDNWKKGLPVYGSARGGCFLDSMRRHTDQALSGATDEPHAIAAIWNAFGAIWTLKHKPLSAMYHNASAVKAEEKPKSTHFDMVDSAIDALKYMSKNKSKYFEEKCNEVLNGRYLTSINPIEDTPEHMDNDNDHFSVTNVTAPSGKKYTIRKWPEGFEPVVDFNKEAFLREMNYDPSLYIEIVNHITKIENENYRDTKYNLEKTIDVLEKIINNKNFSKRTVLVRQTYFDIYTVLAMLNDIIVYFHEYPNDMKRITKIIVDTQDMINHGVGGVHECRGNIFLRWESCPKDKYVFVSSGDDPDEHKLNILYETIGRTARGLLSRDTGGYDPFRGLGITQSLLEFNTYCLERRICKK